MTEVSHLVVTVFAGRRRSIPKHSIVRVHDAFNKLNTEYKLTKNKGKPKQSRMVKTLKWKITTCHGFLAVKESRTKMQRGNFDTCLITE
jgi:hypothetical protein